MTTWQGLELGTLDLGRTTRFQVRRLRLLGLVNIHAKEGDPQTTVADLFIPREVPVGQVDEYVRVMLGSVVESVAIQHTTRHLLFPEGSNVAKRYVRLEMI